MALKIYAMALTVFVVAAVFLVIGPSPFRLSITRICPALVQSDQIWYGEYLAFDSHDGFLGGGFFNCAKQMHQ